MEEDFTKYHVGTYPDKLDINISVVCVQNPHIQCLKTQLTSREPCHSITKNATQGHHLEIQLDIWSIVHPIYVIVFHKDLIPTCIKI